ncbi:MAG: hypothetical protein GY790_01365 [Bacteroidetes bacterium]|nr:hypothetical protein [Bacteroidota bacterium]
MKQIAILFILLLFAGVNSFSQKKSGVVFSEHETITKTQELWKAAVDGDEATYRSFFADTAYIIRNSDTPQKMANKAIGKGLAKWSSNYENLKVGDQKSAYPDALEYKDGGTWVQDWLLMTGVHKETGIMLELPMHSLYAFNNDGKITMMTSYFNNDVFEEIDNSKKIKENGTVYINHPYIVKVRKAVNAFVARDIETMAGYFSPKAGITFSAMKPGEYMSVEEYKTYLVDRYFKDELKYKMEQVGYPDCIHYEKNDMYVVYSWWKLLVKKEGKKYEIPLMFSHDFNDKGEVVRMHVYASDNHFEIF